MTDENKPGQVAADVHADDATAERLTKTIFSLSSLKSTKPRTAEDIARAKAEGRFAEMTPHQAGI